MKLWWPHTEAMVAFLWCYRCTGNIKYLAKFSECTEYALRVFHNPTGSWFGYADQQVRVLHSNLLIFE